MGRSRKVWEIYWTSGKNRVHRGSGHPARVSSLIALRALKLRGYSRTDMIISNDEIYILETNTIPGMPPTSLLPQAAAAHGLSFAALLDRLTKLALEER